MIEISGFYKSYSSSKNAFSVQDVSLCVPDRSVTAILGTNGAGKTTIIKAVCGFHFATGGKITLTDGLKNQFDVAEAPEKVMSLVGFVPENPQLPLNMAVSDFLRYAAKLHDVEDEKKAIERVTEDCSLGNFWDKRIKTLSKGQCQRVSFAQALIHDPPNLVLDEPITGLDPAQIIQMRRLISTLAETKAILLSTHILQEVYSLCKDIYILSDGKVVCSGTESEIVRKSQCADFEEAFMKYSGGGAE